jgi:hypothetical protein
MFHAFFARFSTAKARIDILYVFFLALQIAIIAQLFFGTTACTWVLKCMRWTSGL